MTDINKLQSREALTLNTDLDMRYFFARKVCHELLLHTFGLHVIAEDPIMTFTLVAERLTFN